MNHLSFALSVVTLIIGVLGSIMMLLGIPVVEDFEWSGNWVKGYYAVCFVIAVYAAYRARKDPEDWDGTFNDK